MFDSEALLGLPGFKVTGVRRLDGLVAVSVRYVGASSCPFCGGASLRAKDSRERRVRHESIGDRCCVLVVQTRKWLCRGCGRLFWQRFPGILPRKRSSEPFRRSVANQHRDGIDRLRLGLRERIGGATVDRWFMELLGRKAREFAPACPRVLGIDEHFFSRRDGYATTLCDLGKNRVYDVVLGRSGASLEGYLDRLAGKEKVELVCMDLSNTYRALAKRHFPNARIVADRFHVVRLVNQRFLDAWRMLDPAGSRNRGLLSLVRRHRKNLKSQEQARRLDSYLAQRPAIEAVYGFKQELCGLLLQKHCNARKCRILAPRLLDAIQTLLDSKLRPVVFLGETLRSWQEEVAAMWRFTKNNGITEGFHNKMEAISRRAYGFRNFENYRLRVKVLCS